MKMWAVKTVHLWGRVRDFNRYKRPILASLISAVLIISIIYMRSFLPTAQSGSGGSSNSFEIRIGIVVMTNVTMKGPHIYNSAEGPIEVTNITADVAKISEMNLTKVKEESRLNLTAPSANATKLIVYTTNLTGWIAFDSLKKMKCYGNTPVNISFPLFGLIDVYMEAIYLQAEHFFAQNLSLTCT